MFSYPSVVVLLLPMSLTRTYGQTWLVVIFWSISGVGSLRAFDN